MCIFITCRKDSKCKDWLKREQKGDDSSLESSFNTRLFSPFGPEALPGLRVLSIDSTSRGVNIILSSCVL